MMGHRNIAASFVGISVLTVLCGACWLQKPAQTILTMTQIACVIDNALKDESFIKDACAVADELIPEMRTLIGKERAARKASACFTPSDAGLDADAR